MSLRVAIADDQALVRGGFRKILEAEDDIEVVAEAENGLIAVDAARRFSPDVVLMDIRMPEIDGIEATRRVLSEDGAPRVIVVTTFDLDEYVYEALRAGASGFLLKDIPPEQLVEAVRIVARGEAILSPSVTRRTIEEFVRSSPGGTPRANLDDLTEREHEVFRLMGRGMSNQEIAESLFLGMPTVKTHVGHVLSKLDLRDRVHAVVLAYETGLIRPGEGETDGESL
jgi:DNA-binding NarL/FixJ family response regulator